MSPSTVQSTLQSYTLTLPFPESPTGTGFTPFCLLCSGYLASGAPAGFAELLTGGGLAGCTLEGLIPAVLPALGRLSICTAVVTASHAEG